MVKSILAERAKTERVFSSVVFADAFGTSGLLIMTRASRFCNLIGDHWFFLRNFGKKVR